MARLHILDLRDAGLARLRFFVKDPQSARSERMRCHARPRSAVDDPREECEARRSDHANTAAPALLLLSVLAAADQGIRQVARYFLEAREKAGFLLGDIDQTKAAATLPGLGRRIRIVDTLLSDLWRGAGRPALSRPSSGTFSSWLLEYKGHAVGFANGESLGLVA